MAKINVLMFGASLDQNGGIATVEKLIIKYMISDIKIQHVTSHDEGTINHRIKVFSKSVLILIKKLITEKIDIVHIHLSDGGSVLRKAILTLVSLIFSKPVLMHAHGAEFHVTYAKLPKIAQQALNWVFCRCKGFIVLSNNWQDYYVNNLGLNKKIVIVLPNPTELPEHIPDRRNQAKTKFAFCGRVGQRKGAFDLINAFANLTDDEQRQSQLIIAGDGEIEKAQQLVDELDLKEKVTFLGWINSQQRDDLLSKADVFVLPSYNEGLPMAILEAMGWGLPVIATPVGGIPELVITNQNGLLVSPGNIQQLADAMKLVINNEFLRISLGKVARENVEKFDIKNYCQILANIYSSLTY
ncbi:glycosyltransferase family 4 protein [Nostoc sp. FACHB-152]|uniref:glycosyltransferase family 4 protein n=1 Tax=unclassified Nostoc TaxID=2593658 RepID=UPI001687FB22|nr:MULTISPECIES: glycosyltransferase family 4 protein [unclassified Nostoc]MBD2447499.1 glycosyltransferase family 4 protein [Nostoc sp. FACHB-152]MBD2468309.1 glycosyltransferase family 4 protein [Nostoc sp. FACHB-145]